MNRVIRMLCQKYTDLTDDEIGCLEAYTDILPAMANAEKADIFLDCRTVTGRSAIVVYEASPQSVPSNYSTNIAGRIIQWQDEPAVDRSFRLGVSTIGMRAVSVPENRHVIQTVHPVFYQKRLIAVLVYERTAASADSFLSLMDDTAADVPGPDWSALSDYLEDSVIFFDASDTVCGYNKKAAQLYRDMGYVGDIMGLAASNIQPIMIQLPDCQIHDAFIAGRVLKVRRVPVSGGQAASALILHDETENNLLRQKLSLQDVEMREFRHRMKNNLLMLSGMLRTRSMNAIDPKDTQSVLIDMAGRLLSIAATLENQMSGRQLSLRQLLEQIRQYALQTLLLPSGNVQIQVTGPDFQVPSGCASSIALVVNELVQNALKHAFPTGGTGTIGIEIRPGTPFGQITVWDDGIGFSADTVPDGGMGLELAASIVRGKLTGEWHIASGPDGTRATFDFLIK